MSEQALVPVEQKQVVFYEDVITAIFVDIDNEREIYIPIRPICEYLGIAWRAQNLRIQRDPVLSEVTRSGIITIPEVGKREMTCLPLDYLSGFLFGINASRVKSEVQDRLIRYQKECYKVLAEAFQEGRLTNDPAFDDLLTYSDSEAVEAYKMLQAMMKLARNQIMLEARLNSQDQRLVNHEQRLEEVEAKLGNPDRYITEAQATDISQGVRAISLIMSKRSHRNEYGATWGEFYRAFGVSKYRHLPVTQYEEAMAWLRNWYADLTDDDLPF